MPANILDPDNTRIRDIINLPDSRLQLINFGIVDDGATTLNFEFDGTPILSMQSNGDLTFNEDVILGGSLTFVNAGAGGDPVLSSNSNGTTLTLDGNLEMSGVNAIIFPDANWQILDTSPSIFALLFETISGAAGTIQFENSDFIFQLQLTSEIGFLVNEKVGGSSVSTRPGFLIETQIQADNDVDDEPIMIFDINRQGSLNIVNRPLFEIQNNDTPEWRLNHDGIVTQFGNLVMSDNEIRFEDSNHRIAQVGNNLEIHNQVDGTITLFLGGTFFRFGKEQANWEKKNIINMNQMAFSNTTSQDTKVVSIQRGDSAVGGNNQSLELDANGGGEIVLRVADDEEYNFGANIANFNNNQISNAVLLSTVTGNTGITGLGILSEIVFTGTDNTIFPKDTNTNLRIKANIDLECEVGNAGALVISNRSGSNLFSFSDDRADFLGSDLTNMGILSYQSEVTALVSDVLTPDKTFTILAAETGTTDLLKTINVFGAVNGQTLIITPQQGDAINVENTDNIVLINARPWLMEETRDYMGLIFDGTKWIERYRTEEHVSSISNGIGISSNSALGDVTITVDSTVISGQTLQDPVATDFFLFLSGGNLRKAELLELQFATLFGGGNNDGIGNSDKFFTFGDFAVGATGANAEDLKQFPMPVKVRLDHLTVTIGDNNRTSDATFAIAVNGTITSLQVIFEPIDDNETKFSTTGHIDVNAGEKISLIVKADPTGNNMINLLGFSCIVELTA